MKHKGAKDIQQEDVSYLSLASVHMIVAAKYKWYYIEKMTAHKHTGHMNWKMMIIWKNVTPATRVCASFTIIMCWCTSK